MDLFPIRFPHIQIFIKNQKKKNKKHFSCLSAGGNAICQYGVVTLQVITNV